MKTEVRNTRLKLPETLYRQLKHLAVDRGVPVSALLLEAAETLVEGSDVNQKGGESA